MSKLVNIQAGESLPFEFDRAGNSITGWICTIDLKQFPDDSSIVSRVVPSVVNSWPGFLTQSETTGLSAGLHYLNTKLVNVDNDEEEAIPVRFSITKAWA